MERSTGLGGRLWRIAQALGVLGVAILLVGLVVRPAPSLTILWRVLIPLVPATLLVSPLLWRNVCPLATLELAAGRLAGHRPAARRWASAGAVAGIVLLAVLVPARHVLFNTDGPILAGTIAAVAALAIAGGLAFDAKAGFCNAICPVLPVERLYGQSPLVRIGNPRCSSCTACAPACVDRSPVRAPRQALGAAASRRFWTFSAFGGFAAAFPGFVLGYFTSVDGELSTAPLVYAAVLGWAALSWIGTTAIAAARRITPAQALPSLAAVGAGTYYAFAAPQIATALAVPELGSAGRAAFLALVAVWWVRAERHRRFPARARLQDHELRAA